MHCGAILRPVAASGELIRFEEGAWYASERACRQARPSGQLAQCD
jgi:hypothetical protein